MPQPTLHAQPIPATSRVSAASDLAVVAIADAIVVAPPAAATQGDTGDSWLQPSEAGPVVQNLTPGGRLIDARNGQVRGRGR